MLLWSTHVPSSLRASAVALAGTTVAQALFMRTYISKSLACYQLLFIKQNLSCQVPARLPLWKSEFAMGCLVRIIQIKRWFVINWHCRIPALLFEGAWNATRASHHLSKEPGVLMVLTACKMVLYRNEMNRMWAVSTVHTSDVLTIYHQNHSARSWLISLLCHCFRSVGQRWING